MKFGKEDFQRLDKDFVPAYIKNRKPHVPKLSIGSVDITLSSFRKSLIFEIRTEAMRRNEIRYFNSVPYIVCKREHLRLETEPRCKECAKLHRVAYRKRIAKELESGVTKLRGQIEDTPLKPASRPRKSYEYASRFG